MLLVAGSFLGCGTSSPGASLGPAGDAAVLPDAGLDSTGSNDAGPDGARDDSSSADDATADGPPPDDGAAEAAHDASPQVCTPVAPPDAGDPACDGVTCGLAELQCVGGRCARGRLVVDTRCDDGEVRGSYELFDGGKRVLFTVTRDGSSSATATFQEQGALVALTSKVLSETDATLKWGPVELDGKGTASTQELSTIDQLAFGDLGKILRMIPLDAGCMIPELEPAQLEALLFPLQAMLKYRGGPIDLSSETDESACYYYVDAARLEDTSAVAARPSRVHLSAQSPIPTVFLYLPLDEAGAADNPNRGKLHGPCGATCRGACGEDCTLANCQRKEDWVCEVDGSGANTGLKTAYTYTMTCGTHEACVTHDDCYDSCNAAWGCGGWYSPSAWAGAACRRQCDKEACAAWGILNCKDWAEGAGTFTGQDTWTYDLPFFKSTTDLSLCPLAAADGGTGCTTEVLFDRGNGAFCSIDTGSSPFTITSLSTVTEVRVWMKTTVIGSSAVGYTIAGPGVSASGTLSIASPTSCYGDYCSESDTMSLTLQPGDYLLTVDQPYICANDVSSGLGFVTVLGCKM